MSLVENRFLGKLRHQEAAKDIPLVFHLLCNHCTLIIAAYDPANRGIYPLVVQARTAMAEFEKFKGMLYEQARQEHPGAEFLNQYESEYTGTTWPSRITGQEVGA